MPRALYILLLVFGLAPAQLFAAAKGERKSTKAELRVQAFTAAHTELDKAPVQVLPAAQQGHWVSAGAACAPTGTEWPSLPGAELSGYTATRARIFAPVHLRHNYFSHGFF